MNVLLIGDGGREHAIARALSGSPRLDRLYAVPGNPGIARHARLVPLDIADHTAIVDFCRKNAVDLVVIGPEAPLAAGLVDDLTAARIPAFGPTCAAARLESSKGYTKDLCREHGIPTAAFARFSGHAEASEYVRLHGAPIVIKADGLAAGKGVTVAETLEEALQALNALFANGPAEVVVEDKMEGPEVSLFVLCDGETALVLGAAQDHKRVGDGDTGPNTGGMGAYSPVPAMTEELTQRALGEIIRPTLSAMAARGTPFKGVLFAGLMLTAAGPKLIEYNCRFGDPEAQVILPLLDTDLLLLMHASVSGTLVKQTCRQRPGAALAVVMAAHGYPGRIRTGDPIAGLDSARAIEGVEVFEAGVATGPTGAITARGRVLAATGIAPTLVEARERAYRAVDLIRFEGAVVRRDIGWRAL
jgi:phosphoribosylamine---glycine ligase